MKLVPISLREANDYVMRNHRHHGPSRGHKFSLAAEHEGRLVGVCIVGRPVARALDDGQTLEVTRMCTDGTRNAASFLYGAARRAGSALGYAKLVTYTLDSEPGTSLRAAGWSMAGISPGRSWSVPSRPRIDRHPLGPKVRYEVKAHG